MFLEYWLHSPIVIIIPTPGKPVLKADNPVLALIFGYIYRYQYSFDVD